MNNFAATTPLRQLEGLIRFGGDNKKVKDSLVAHGKSTQIDDRFYYATMKQFRDSVYSRPSVHF